MKKGRWFFYNLFLILALAIPASSAVTASGTVSDSATGAMLNAVKVKCLSPVCSTATAANGTFTLTIPSTEINFSAAEKTALKIFYNPAKNYFYAGEEKFYAKIFNGKGAAMTGDKLSPGNYFAVCKLGSFRFFNIGQGQEIIFGSATGSGKSLAKTAAITSVVATFTLTGYNPTTKTIYIGQNNLVKLSGIPSGSNANLNIGIAPLDTLKGVAIIL